MPVQTTGTQTSPSAQSTSAYVVRRESPGLTRPASRQPPESTPEPRPGTSTTSLRFPRQGTPTRAKPRKAKEYAGNQGSLPNPRGRKQARAMRLPVANAMTPPSPAASRAPANPQPWSFIRVRSFLRPPANPGHGVYACGRCAIIVRPVDGTCLPAEAVRNAQKEKIRHPLPSPAAFALYRPWTILLGHSPHWRKGLRLRFRSAQSKHLSVSQPLFQGKGLLTRSPSVDPKATQANPAGFAEEKHGRTSSSKRCRAIKIVDTWWIGGSLRLDGCQFRKTSITLSTPPLQARTSEPSFFSRIAREKSLAPR